MDASSDTAPAAYGGFDTMPIAGRWRAGSTGKARADINPFTDETLLEIPQADADDVDQAYRAAAKAQLDWAAEPPSVRAGVMQAAAQILKARREEVIGWLIRESGSTRMKAGLECDVVFAGLQEAAIAAYRVEGRILLTDIPGKEGRAYRKPVGVVGVISPWNWPLQLTNRSVAPALAVGNGVVVKPASDTPVTGGLILAKIFEEAGLPDGLLSVVVGSGSDIGDTFTKHPVPRVLSFTGSTPVGRGVARAAADAEIIKRTELELGGNSPLVVLEDADIDYAVDAAIFGKFLHQGQICMITNRLIVADPVYDAFCERFAERARGLKAGDPNDPDTVIGPIINDDQVAHITTLIDGARRTGARELAGGEPQGRVIPPHVFADVTNDMDIAASEIFGPVAPIIRARDEEDALAIANDTEHGLSSAVFTQDLERGARFARRIQAGMSHVNDQPVNDIANNPFGGEKNSGLGRFGGEWAVDAFTTDQWVTLQHSRRAFPTDA